MHTLRIDVKVKDYDMWREAFEKDAAGRARSGARAYRIFRTVEDRNRVLLDLDFRTQEKAEGFLRVMREEVWPSTDKAPAKLGAPQANIVELVETKAYETAV